MVFSSVNESLFELYRIVTEAYGPRRATIRMLAQRLHIGVKNANKLTIRAGYRSTLERDSVTRDIFAQDATVRAIGKLWMKRNGHILNDSIKE